MYLQKYFYDIAAIYWKIIILCCIKINIIWIFLGQKEFKQNASWKNVIGKNTMSQHRTLHLNDVIDETDSILNIINNIIK